MKALQVFVLIALAATLRGQQAAPPAAPPSFPLPPLKAQAPPKARSAHARPKTGAKKETPASAEKPKAVKHAAAAKAESREARAGAESKPNTETAQATAPQKPAHQPAAQVEAGPGGDLGGGYRACRNGDNSPAGTVKDGWKKVLVPTPMGDSCHWEKAE
jgi:hypothetical protein